MNTRHWKVNAIEAHLVGGLYARLNISFPSLNHPLSDRRDLAIWSELVFISICHQTNWDRLRSAILTVAQEDPSAIYPEELSQLKKKRFLELFGRGLDPGRVRAKERLKLLRQLGSSWTSRVNPDLKFPAEVTLGGDEGFYRLLMCLPPFCGDPVEKKSRVLVHQLLRHRLINVLDQWNVRPAVDYHIMRLYIRTRRVVPTTKGVVERLQTGGAARVEFISDLRSAVEEAMWYTKEGADLPMEELNQIEWQIGRSFCVRVGPRCCGPAIPEKPLSGPLAEKAQPRGGGCLLAGTCPGANHGFFKSLKDPVAAGTFF